jgi:hypothetical protein
VTAYGVDLEFLQFLRGGNSLWRKSPNLSRNPDSDVLACNISCKRLRAINLPSVLEVHRALAVSDVFIAGSYFDRRLTTTHAQSRGAESFL